jgi:hypothetical protein
MASGFGSSRPFDVGHTVKLWRPSVDRRENAVTSASSACEAASIAVGPPLPVLLVAWLCLVVVTAIDSYRSCASAMPELVIGRGAPWDKLLNVAADLGADLIVVGAHGRRGLGPFLGSVTTRLATASTRCVLIVPASLGVGPAMRRGLL